MAAGPPQCNSRVGGFTHTPPHQLANPPTPAVKYQEFCPPVSRPFPEGQDRSASLSSEVKPSCFRQNFGGGPGPFIFSSTPSHRTHTPPHPQADPRPGNYIVMAFCKSDARGRVASRVSCSLRAGARCSWSWIRVAFLSLRIDSALPLQLKCSWRIGMPTRSSLTIDRAGSSCHFIETKGQKNRFAFAPSAVKSGNCASALTI